MLTGHSGEGPAVPEDDLGAWAAGKVIGVAASPTEHRPGRPAKSERSQHRVWLRRINALPWIGQRPNDFLNSLPLCLTEG